MGVIDTVKDVAGLIQKMDNIELIRRMVELQQQVYELVNENRDLHERGRTLQERLNTREQMVFRENAYWRGEEGPYCSRCFDADSLSVRMLVRKGYYPRCPKCGTTATDPNREPPQTSPGRRARISWMD